MVSKTSSGSMVNYIFSIGFMRQLIMALAVVILGIVGFWGYRSYVITQERKAQKLFSTYLAEYNHAIQYESTQDQWGAIALHFKTGYEQYSRSNLAPYFLIFQSHSLLKQGNRAQAIDAMNQSLDILPKNSPLYGLYAANRALLNLDSPQAAEQEVGLNELKQLASTMTNIYRDQALYYIGAYHWSKDDIENATTTWQQLLNEFPVTSAEPSPWAQEAHQRLQHII